MKPLRVTDHCVLRYLERAKGVDIEAIRLHIAELCGPAARVGAASLKAEGVAFQISGSTVITTTPIGTTASRTRQAILSRGA